jgi:hypothetical protein
MDWFARFVSWARLGRPKHMERGGHGWLLWAGLFHSFFIPLFLFRFLLCYLICKIQIDSKTIKKIWIKYQFKANSVENTLALILFEKINFRTFKNNRVDQKGPFMHIFQIRFLGILYSQGEYFFYIISNPYNKLWLIKNTLKPKVLENTILGNTFK